MMPPGSVGNVEAAVVIGITEITDQNGSEIQEEAEEREETDSIENAHDRKLCKCSDDMKAQLDVVLYAHTHIHLRAP